MALATAAAAAPVLALNAGGCGGGPATTQPSTTADRQADALRDPMNWKPQVPGPSGDDGHVDSNSLQQDLNNVFNP